MEHPSHMYIAPIQDQHGMRTPLFLCISPDQFIQNPPIHTHGMRTNCIPILDNQDICVFFLRVCACMWVYSCLLTWVFMSLNAGEVSRRAFVVFIAIVGLPDASVASRGLSVALRGSGHGAFFPHSFSCAFLYQTGV